MPSTIGIVASTFNPNRIANLTAWWDASDSSTITASGSPSKVSQWNDKKGSVNLLQASSALQPLTASASQNGKNVITFDGTDSMESSAALSISGASASTTFIVMSTDRNAVGNDLIFGWGEGLSLKARHFGIGSGTTNMRIAYFGAPYLTSTALSLNTYRAYVASYDGSTSFIWRNKTAATPSSAATGTVNTSAYNAYVGAFLSAGYWSGNIAEILVYSANLSTADREFVVDYLTAKWAL